MDKIFITNDDGYESQLIHDLYDYISSRYSESEHILMAPHTNCSGVSHAITLDKKIPYSLVEKNKYIVHGYPVDCTLLGSAFFSPIDLVISGPNDGFNLAQDVMYSGTIAAAREAAFKNIPAIAFSIAGDELGLESSTFEYELWHTFLDTWLDRLIAMAQIHVGSIITVNVAHPVSLELYEAPLGIRYYAPHKNPTHSNTLIGTLQYAELSNTESIMHDEKNTDIAYILDSKSVYSIIKALPCTEQVVDTH